MSFRVGVLTVSDRCFKGQRKDLSGPALVRLARDRGWRVQTLEIVPDEAKRISAKLKLWCDRKNLDLILTSGGTGLGPRDVTPEATRAILHKEVPGISERMRREGERITPMAALSRAVCGFRGRTLLLNLPGSLKGASQSFKAVYELLPHALEMLRGADHDRRGRSA